MSAVPFSYRQYAGNGSTTTFSVPFPYLLKSHVKVYIGFNILDGTYSSELADGTGFTWSSGTQIQCTTAPASGQTLTVIRVTPNTTRLVDWQDGSNLISNDLDTADLQNLYVIQEQQDRNDAGITQSNAAAAAAAAATTASTTATTTANTALSTANTAISTANTASTNASAAVATANTASTNASAAVATANTASTNASAAVATANTASANASSAVTTANSAVTTANSAVTTANSAVTTANNANTTAQAANTTATNAESIANSALSIVAGTVQFVPVANVAAIPASPSNDDAVQIQDSTGIQSFSPLTGLPAGFTGTPQLFVRIQYDTPGSTWQYVGYGPNDPDNRYVVQGVLGTANNPSFYFDADTGIYSPGSNELGLSTGGAARLTIDSAGNVAVPGTLGVTGAITGSLTGAASLNVLKAGDTMTGNLTAPALIPSGSTAPSNGVYLPAANSVAISTNSTGRLFIDSNGHVGIGVSSPLNTNYRFSVVGNRSNFAANSSALNLYLQYNSSTNGVFIGSPAADALSFSDSGGSERMRLTTTGLGIGTSSPGSELVVTKSSGNTRLTVQGGTNGDGTIALAGAGTGIGKISAWDQLAFGKSSGGAGDIATEWARFDSSGRLGIGTTTFTTDCRLSIGSGALNFIGNSTAPNASSFIYRPGDNSLGLGTDGLERCRLDSSGRLLVGTSSGSLSYSSVVIRNNPAASGVQGTLELSRGSVPSTSGHGIGTIAFTDSSSNLGASIEGLSEGSWTSGSNHRSRLVFSTTADGASSPTERMRILESGRIWFGNTSSLGNFKYHFPYTGGSTNGIILRNTDNSGGPSAIAFEYGTTQVGYISVSSTTTTYVTTSDYRAKENVTTVTDGITRLQQLKPSRFNFIADPAKTVDGFIAHEVQSVVPEAITGEKDAVDGDGNPVYQGIDQSKLVPLLTAALQEAVAKIEGLEARLTAAGI